MSNTPDPKPESVEQKLEKLIRALKPDLGFGNVILGETIAQIERVRMQTGGDYPQSKRALKIQLEKVDSVVILATGTIDEIKAELVQINEQLLVDLNVLLAWSEKNLNHPVSLIVSSGVVLTSDLSRRAPLMFLIANRSTVQQFAYRLLMGLEAAKLLRLEVKAIEEKSASGQN